MSPLSPCFLALAFLLFLSFLLLMSCARRTSLWTVYHHGFLLYPSMLSRLRYPTLFQLSPFRYFLPYSPCQVWLATSLFGMFLIWKYILSSQLPHVYNCFNGYIPSSALDTVLLVVFEHLTYYSGVLFSIIAAAICAVSSWKASFNPRGKVRVCQDRTHVAYVCCTLSYLARACSDRLNNTRYS